MDHSDRLGEPSPNPRKNEGYSMGEKVVQFVMRGSWAKMNSSKTNTETTTASTPSIL